MPFKFPVEELYNLGKGRFASMAEAAASVGTTSREVALVLAGDQRIQPDLRRRISDAIDSGGYRPLESVQADLGRPLRLAIVSKLYPGDVPGMNRFYTPVETAIAQSALDHGATITQVPMRVDDRFNLLEIPPELRDGSCDGAFIVGAQLTPIAVELLRTGACPIVLVDGYSEGDAVHSVVTDNAEGGRIAVEVLIAAGHRDIGMLGTEPISYPSMQARRTAYIDTVRAHGLRKHLIDTEYIFPDAAAIIGVSYVRAHPEVTALFAANDWIGVMFMQAARDAGYRVPGDLSIVGFDDIDLATLVMPALTTLAIDKALMGRAGLMLLAHRLEAPAAEPVNAVITPQLVERESVAPPPAG